MRHTCTAQHMSDRLQAALESGALDREADTAAVFYDLAQIRGRVAAIAQAFPPHSIHALAIKANPLPRLLAPLVAEGAALEAASLVELELAARLGAGTIVFDSPAKTEAELERALELGAIINVDNHAELERLAKLLADRAPPRAIGLRVNPQVGGGTIPTTAVSSATSKFGVALLDPGSRAGIIEAFRRHAWLSGLHVHTGSQGMDPSELVEGARRLVALAEDIDEALAPSARRVEIIDIGGGLPVAYHEGALAPTVASYAQQLGAGVPQLFGDRFRLITEFGRHVHANAGWVASRIEYLKPTEPPTAITHVGADMFLRLAYVPQYWHHGLSVCDAAGRLRRGPRREFAVAGPLCFASDFLARQVSLPADTRAGDYVLVHDAGAYTLSMWSRYNSRQLPKVIGYEDGRFETLRRRESVDEVLRFWQGPDGSD